MNPHPLLTGFPIVLITLAFMLELSTVFRGLEKPSALAHKAVYTACVFGLLTYFSGYWALDYANVSFQVPEDKILNHQLSAQIFVFCISASALFAYAVNHAKHGRDWVLWSYRLLLFCGFMLASYTGMLGGELVFKHGAGVEISSAEAPAAPLSEGN